MQAAGMLRGTGAVFAQGVSVLLLGTLILAFVGDTAHALPLQILPNIPGYIPVYIRNGDQPLDEINPALAEAFHEKQILESLSTEGLDHSPDDSQVDTENDSSYDEDDELSVEKRKKGTIFLIGVRQSNGDESKRDDDGIVRKIVLPFDVLERSDIEGNAADNQDRDRAEDAWIGEPAKESHERKPIGLSKEAAIKVGGLPANVRKLERRAAKVENEETLPNDLYESSIDDDHHHVSSLHRTIPRKSTDEDKQEIKEIKWIIEDVMDDRGVRPVEDLKESRSSRSTLERESTGGMIRYFRARSLNPIPSMNGKNTKKT